MLEDLIVWWAASFDCNGQWKRALCMVVVLKGFQPNPQVNWNCRIMPLNKSRSVQNTGTCYQGLGWFCQGHLGFGLSATAQIPDKPALAWVVCPIFCPDLNLYSKEWQAVHCGVQTHYVAPFNMFTCDQVMNRQFTYHSFPHAKINR